jgi:hypothetical protein
MENKAYLNFGKTFYEWYRSDKLKFISKEDNQNLNTEIERVSELIEYVRKKRERLTDPGAPSY